MTPTLHGIPLAHPYSRFASLTLARMAARSRGGVIFPAEPCYAVVEAADAPRLIRAGHYPHGTPPVQVLVRALGYTARELVTWRCDRGVWVLDLGAQHGGGAPQHVRFGEPGSGADYVAVGISEVSEEEALRVAISVVGA